MRNNRTIPFWLLPGSWGLKGRTRSRAEAEYYLTGEDLDRRLADIDSDSDEERKRRHLKLDLKYNYIDEFSYRQKLVEVDHQNDLDRKLAQLALNHEFGKISKTEYEKQAATLRNEPYVGVMSSEFDPTLKANGMYFELDWNDEFIEMLQESGYDGLTQEQIVNRWFDDLCRSIAEVAEEDEETPSRPVSQVKREDGRVEYS